MAGLLERTLVKSALALSIVTAHHECMKLTRSTWQSYNIVVGMVTDELNLERSGKMDNMKSLCTGSVLKSGV